MQCCDFDVFHVSERNDDLDRVFFGPCCHGRIPYRTSIPGIFRKGDRKVSKMNFGSKFSKAMNLSESFSFICSSNCRHGGRSYGTTISSWNTFWLLNQNARRSIRTLKFTPKTTDIVQSEFQVPSAFQSPFVIWLNIVALWTDAWWEVMNMQFTFLSWHAEFQWSEGITINQSELVRRIMARQQAGETGRARLRRTILNS
jgi:hypothetical protein